MAKTSTMRALLLTKAPGAKAPALTFSPSHPVPAPKAGELLIKVYASAIQPSDVFNMHGGFGSTTFPRVPGRDWSGVVAAVGDESSAPSQEFPVGTAVFGSSGSSHSFTNDGCHAESTIVPVEAVAPKPTGMTHVQAASIGVPFTTAKLTVQRSGAKKGETVLVIGANGSVGKAACAMLEDIGCNVLRGLRGPGGDIDTTADPTLKTVRTLHPKGIEAVIDTVGIPSMTRAAIDDCLAVRGRLVYIIAPKGEDVPELTFSMRTFYRQEKSVIGVNSVAHPIAEMGELLRDLKDVFESGQWTRGVRSEEWERVKLEDAVTAYQSKDKAKKYVVDMGVE
jgi:NADPH2:quinone reductase